MMTITDDRYDLAPEEGAENSEDQQPIKSRWYAIQVASGCEKKVKASLQQRALTMGVSENILRIEIPQTPVVRLKKDGSRQQIDEKIFPGYVLLRVRLEEDKLTGKWEIGDETWQVVKSTPHVINFVGSEQKRAPGMGRGRGHVKPMPLSHSEVDRIFKQSEQAQPEIKADFTIGEQILVLDGPFKDFEGEVIEVTPERTKLKALLSIFGRDTPVELEFKQVQKQT
ncbi:MAG: transcription termination/antitermination protein NusG [Prochlorotrichaceae cyanobacterium]